MINESVSCRGLRGAPGRLVALVLLGWGCASAHGGRAALIADADRAARAAVAAEGSLHVAALPPASFAVLPFSVPAQDTLLRPLGFAIADFLVTDLSRSAQLRMVERLRTNAILDELNLAGRTDSDSAGLPRIGRIVGARRLLLGTASLVGGTTVRFDTRVVDVVDGTVAEVAVAEAPLDRIIDAQKSLALLVLERLAITVTPAERRRIEGRPPIQLAALVAYGRGVEAEGRGDVAGALSAFDEAVRIDGAIRVATSQRAGATSSSVASRVPSIDRVVEMTSQGVNASLPVRVAEAVDAPLVTSSVLSIILVIRVLP